ncbi:SdrD B-like domain-containing protein [Bremerella sp. JC770]|uniref:SdrD B-like domain-containing protein n=1 Tax=Bremerella sp. JC770 TaxID=3232137 RepID=UPI00345A824E
MNKRAKRQRAMHRVEPLEKRAMLAGDLLTAIHNDYMPHDVNNDGTFDQLDVDTLLTTLKSNKTQQTAARGLLEGEQTLYLDIDNDGRVTNRDLMAAMDALALEGELAEGTFRADVDLVLIVNPGEVDEEEIDEDSLTNGMSDVNQTFQLQVWIEDTSDTPSSVDAAFVDIMFDQTLVSLDPATGIVLGAGFTSGTGATPNNVTPYGALNGQQDFNNYNLPNTLRFIGGRNVDGAPTETDPNNPNSRLLATLTFTTIAEGTVNFEVVIQDNPQSVEVDDVASSFNTLARDGEVSNNSNVNATFFSGAGPNEISRWTGGDVALDIMAQPAPGANFDSYEVVEDYLEDDAVPAGDYDPPIVEIDEVQYYVLDVLANDLDNANNPVAAPRTRFQITDFDDTGLEGILTLQNNAQSIQDIVDAGIGSHQVFLYQVPPGRGGITTNFTYEMTDTGSPDTVPGTTEATVFISITDVDQNLRLNPENLLVEVPEGVSSGEIDILDSVEIVEEGDEITFLGFFDENGGPLTAADLQGTFEIPDETNFPTVFTYISNTPGLEETISYQVTDGTNEPLVGYITFKTLSDTALSGVVYFDADNDGVVDENADTNASPEKRIGGVTVELIDSNDMVVETTVTDAFGAYSFANFDEGTYSVRVVDPRFTRKGLTTAGSFTVSGDTISGIQVGNGEPGTFEGLNFGYRGRDFAYLGIADSIASNTEDSITLAFSKPGGLDSLEWYAVDLGWELLVQVRSDLSFFDAETGDSQIAFEVAVDGLEESIVVVQAFSTSNPGYRLVADGPEGMIIRIDGGAADVMSNLNAAIDAAFASM